ncbi:MAG: serine hydrolase [Pseudomonadota bacterium]
MTELMQSFPPSTGGQVTLANWRTAPFNAWAFHHVSEIVPSAVMHNDPAAAKILPSGSRVEMPGCRYSGEALDFEAFCARCNVDALVVLHRGHVVHEHYANGMTAQDPHILMSVSKSMLGLICGILADRGVLDIDAKAITYVPEIASTAFRDTTVRDLLDMRSGIHFIEDYLATEGQIVDYRKSTNWNPLAPGEAETDLRSFLLSLTYIKTAPGGDFDYISPCTDLLGWIIERAANKPYASVFSELLLKPLRAESPAMITVDRLGAPRTAGGKSLTARTLAQVGQMLVEDGAGVVPKSWIDDIEQNGDPGAWDRGSMKADFQDISMHYRSKWYVLRDRGPIIMGIGIHGQNLIVDRKAELVMARFCSGPEPLNIPSDLAAVSLFENIRGAIG